MFIEYFLKKNLSNFSFPFRLLPFIYLNFNKNIFFFFPYNDIILPKNILLEVLIWTEISINKNALTINSFTLQIIIAKHTHTQPHIQTLTKSSILVRIHSMVAIIIISICQLHTNALCIKDWD